MFVPRLARPEAVAARSALVDGEPAAARVAAVS